MKNLNLIILLLLVILADCTKDLNDLSDPYSSDKIVKMSGKSMIVLLGVSLDATRQGVHHYYWKNVNNIMIIPDSNSPIILPPDTGIYYVIYDYGTDSTKVIVEPPDYCYYPNSFLPHSGIPENRIWKVVLSGIRTFNIKILTQDNIIVYESNDYAAHGWDGTYKGKDCPMGYYYFILKYDNLNGQKRIKTGIIELIR
jgi:hypothetical protein